MYILSILSVQILPYLHVSACTCVITTKTMIATLLVPAATINLLAGHKKTHFSVTTLQGATAVSPFTHIEDVAEQCGALYLAQGLGIELLPL